MALGVAHRFFVLVRLVVVGNGIFGVLVSVVMMVLHLSDGWIVVVVMAVVLGGSYD